jgi:DNA topoisomerase-1
VSELREYEGAANKANAANAAGLRAAVTESVKKVAAQLGNTPAVCRACYIHPDVIDAFEDGSLATTARRGVPALSGLRADEALTLTLLRRRARSRSKSRCHSRTRQKAA